MMGSEHSIKLILSDAGVIFQKELKNLLKDRRALFSILILPLLLVPILFIGMDFVAGIQQEEAEANIYRVELQHINDPQFSEILNEHISITEQYAPEQTPELIIAFPEQYTPGDHAQVDIFYDSSSQKMIFAASQVEQAIRGYNDMLAEQRLQQVGMQLQDLKMLNSNRIDTAPEQARGAGMIIGLIPFYILIYVFAGSMSVGMDATAGEKERGSIAVILVNQVSRSSIALGKILYVLSVGTASSLMTFFGIVIAFSSSGSMFGGSISITSFPLSTILSMLLIILVTSMLAASIIVLLGSLARTVKEASSYVMPIYILVMVMGVMTMNLDSPGPVLSSIIPLASTVFVLKSALIGEGTLLQMLLFLLVDSLCIFFLLYATARVYNSEKILEGPAS
jgi:sodium transport system permease protein